MIDEGEIELAEKLSKYGYFYQTFTTFSLPCPVVEIIIADTFLHGKYEYKSLAEFSFSNFIFAAIQHLNKNELKKYFNLAETLEELEKCLQMEFYSSARSIKPKDLTKKIGFEMGSFFNAEGLLDFYVNSKYEWGIELIIQSNEVKEHLNRFKLGGTYYYLSLKDWGFINFIRKNDQYYKEEKLWNVIVEEDLSQITIINEKDEKFTFELKNEAGVKMEYKKKIPI